MGTDLKTLATVLRKQQKYWKIPHCKEINFRAIRGAYFSKTEQCWLIPFNFADEKTVLQLTTPTQDTSDELLNSPLKTEKLHHLDMQKLTVGTYSLKYKLMHKLIITYELSISELCSLKITELKGARIEISSGYRCGTILEIHRLLLPLIKRYLHQYEPCTFLFEEQPGQMFSAEKYLRILRSAKKRKVINVP